MRPVAWTAKRFDPDQARDDRGRWSETPGGATSGDWEWADDETRIGNPETVRPQHEEWPRGMLSDADMAACRYYSGGGYKDLNLRLQEGLSLEADQRDLANHLDRAIERAGEYPADKRPTVWRGVRIYGAGLRGAELARLSGGERNSAVSRMVAEWAADRYPVGAEVRPKGYQSTSFLVGPALNGALGTEDPGVIFEIKARTGALLDDPRMRVYDDEMELLQGRDTRYSVRKVLPAVKFEQFESGTVVERTVVQLEEL